MLFRNNITVIMAVYNRVNVVEQAISSVVNQNYDKFELIVIDGGSTDGTVDILKKYDSNIRWISEPDNGIYDAWNKGVKMATGDYIIFMGSDDCLLNYDVLTVAATYLEKYENVDFLCGGVVIVDERTKVECVDRGNFRTIKPGVPFFSPIQGMLIKSDILKKELFDTSFLIAADIFFMRKCFYQLNCTFTEVNLLTMYFSNGGISSIIPYNNSKRTADRLKCLETFGLKNTEPSLLLRAKQAVWRVLDTLGLKEKVHTMLHGHVYRKHHCTNKICRWCGRYEADLK